ncbi:potassium voltage-gated channel subfamily H member 7-like isoform X8 [Condylostylus longicornis]|uniref:potassium voltage-gated channel subfamily H member 7-like isoform X8 n=1 Tax=Condylostylus longicornis TaxID=2530218 RepID=UPI00244DA9F2|nr:potassium voltage-gated channel subfamily H member 7-like isoform X8 [Condylostylus longicornis]
MPVRRGHVAPKTTLIETIIRKFDTHNRSFLVANAQSETHHIIWCSDGFCKMTGFTRAEVMQRSSSTDFLHGPMTSQVAVNLIREALTKGYEKHFEILYYRKNGTKFLCSEVIAPIRSEADDISLYIINFEDLSNPTTSEPPIDEPPGRLSKFDRARASFKQSFKFGGLRERGLRLAGYLTPPSDVTQEEEEAHENQVTLPKIESGKVWTPVSTPTSTLRSKETEKLRDSLRLEDLKTVVPDKPVTAKKDKSEFVHTKSLDFDSHYKGAAGHQARQFFPCVSSESDLQRYKAISFRQNSCIIEPHQRTTSSSLSNVPSDMKSDKQKHFSTHSTPRSAAAYMEKHDKVTCHYPFNDNGSAKFFQGSRHTPNMGEKVAQIFTNL